MDLRSRLNLASLLFIMWIKMPNKAIDKLIDKELENNIRLIESELRKDKNVFNELKKNLSSCARASLLRLNPRPLCSSSDSAWKPFPTYYPRRIDVYKQINFQKCVKEIYVINNILLIKLGGNPYKKQILFYDFIIVSIILKGLIALSAWGWLAGIMSISPAVG